MLTRLRKFFQGNAFKAWWRKWCYELIVWPLLFVCQQWHGFWVVALVVLVTSIFGATLYAEGLETGADSARGMCGYCGGRGGDPESTMLPCPACGKERE